MLHRSLALLAAVTLAVAGCADADRPPIERVSGTIGPSDASDGGAASATAGGDRGDGGDGGDGGAATEGTGSGSAPGAQGSSAGGAASTGGAARTAATAALDAYFDALQAQDFKAAQRASTGGPRFMATIREVVHRYNTEREGVTKLSYSSRSFVVAANEPNRVTFSGAAKLDSTTSGPAGDPRSETRTFENPVVTFVEGQWRVADYRFDGDSIIHHPSTSRTRVGGIDLRLLGALSFGKSTAIVIDLISDADHGIRLDDEKITYADGTTAQPTLGALISQKPAALYFLFDRVSSPPTSWSATITVDKGTENETKADVVLRF